MRCKLDSVRRRGRSSGPAKHGLISVQLEKMLTSGSYRPGDFLPPERLLAEQFAVSRPTIRRAIASLVERGLLVNRPGIGTSIRPCEEDKTTQQWSVIGLLIPNFSNPFFVEVAEAVEQAALQRGYQVLLCNSRHQASLEEMHLQQLIKARVSGVILVHDPYSPFPKAASALREAATPYVALFNSPSTADCDSVILDDRGGVVEALRYLCSLGHRQIAYCRAMTGTYTHPRENAYREFLEQNQLSVPSRFCVPSLAALGPDAFRVFKELFRGVPTPTAILAENDDTALMCHKFLNTLGKQVPRDVSLVGFDNLRFTEHLPIPLTTVDQPKREMGRRAFEILLDRMEFGFSSSPRLERFRPQLVIRESCSIVASRIEAMAPFGAADATAQ